MIIRAHRLLMICVVAACSGDGTTPPHMPDPSASVTVDIPFCSSFAPNWVAFQDGGGGWTRALPVVDGQKTRFRHSFSSDRGAVAVGRILGLGRAGALTIQYGAPQELIIVADSAAPNCGPTGGRTLLGTAAGIDTNQLAAVTAGPGPGALLAPDQTTFALQGLVPGPQVVLATLFSRVNDTKQLTKVILRRTPDLPDSTRLSLLDFNSAEAFEPVLAHATIAGVEPTGALLVNGLLTPHSQALLGGSDASAGGNRRTMAAIPAERLRDGELQLAMASIVSTDFARRSASVYFRDPIDQVVTLGATASTPAVSAVSTTPSLRLRATFDAQPDYERLTTIVFVQQERTITVGATAAYARLGAYDLVMPDLAGVAGFDSRWGLRADAPVFWTVSRVGGTLGLGIDAQPFIGATSRSAERFGSFSP